MLMSLLNNLNNSNKLQLDSSETTKLVPVSNQDISLVEPKKKCKLRKLLIILLLIIGSGLATYVHIYSLIYGWKQITKVATLIGENSGKLKNHIQRRLEDYDKLWSGTICSFTTITTLRCQINESTRLAFLDFFPHPTHTFSTLLVYLAPKSTKTFDILPEIIREYQI